MIFHVQRFQKSAIIIPRYIAHSKCRKKPVLLWYYFEIAVSIIKKRYMYEGRNHTAMLQQCCKQYQSYLLFVCLCTCVCVFFPGCANFVVYRSDILCFSIIHLICYVKWLAEKKLYIFSRIFFCDKLNFNYMKILFIKHVCLLFSRLTIMEGPVTFYQKAIIWTTVDIMLLLNFLTGYMET